MLVCAGTSGHSSDSLFQSPSCVVNTSIIKDVVSGDILRQHITILGMEEYKRLALVNSPIPHQPQQTSVSTTIRAIAVRLPVFDKMSAAAFDAMMSKTMEHFLGPLLSIGCRGSCLLTEPVSWYVCVRCVHMPFTWGNWELLTSTLSERLHATWMIQYFVSHVLHPSPCHPEQPWSWQIFPRAAVWRCEFCALSTYWKASTNWNASSANILIGPGC